MEGGRTEAGDPGAIRITRDARGRLVYRARPEADPVEGVRATRCFPWSAPGDFLSIRDADGNELCLVKSVESMEAETRARIEEELGAQEFIPKITAIHSVEDRFDVIVWTIETDRGPIELQVQHAEDVRQLDDGRVLVKDHAGGLFEVPDVSRLDIGSRRLLEDHLP